MGRVGAIISPIVAGALIDGGWEPGNLYFLFIVPMLVGGAAIACLRSVRRKAAAPAQDTVPA